MKKIVVAFVMGLLVTACITRSDSFETTKIVGEKTILDTDGNIAFEVKINVDFPKKGIPTEILSGIQYVLLTDLFGSDFSTKHIDSIANAYIDTTYKEYAFERQYMELKSDYKYCYQEFLDGEIEQKNAQFLSYKMKRYYFSGGTHGLETTTFLTFDLANGTQVTQSDIFINGFEEPVRKLLVEKLQKEFQERGSDMDNLWIDQILPNDNFALTEKGVKFWFNPYEIAPYSEGSACVTLTYEELKHWLRPNNASLNTLLKEEKW